MSLETRIRNVTAVLGPTNTGKTHLAIERMLGHASGLIGLPLRLLAREVYDKIAARAGVQNVALITGEEKIKPEHARYWVCTVEAMPREIDVDFLAIDEVQLAADPDRGHVFTDRLLHARGRSETLLLGAGTMREAIADLIPGANFIARPRLSKLTYSGQKKITRLPKRSAVVAFSANEVYEIAELVRRQLGGAAVVLGALSPRTRNAQVALFQSGDVDYLIATDAIGMGLNLNVDHVALAGVRKFDGQNHRNLTPAELGQVAGRAGRYMNDGTFGVTGDVEPLEADLIERLETHTFETIKVLQWRNRSLEFGSLERLRESLRQPAREVRLQRARMADDVIALETVSADQDIARLASVPAAVAKLWDVCQIPDYRKISSQNHAELVAALYKFLMSPEERIPEDWFANQVAQADRTDGDIDTLANRIAHIRTWTFVANRSDWLKDPAHWQGRTRDIEDSLSDALHEQLTQRFVDKRTSALMRGMRDPQELNAEIDSDGAIRVENHYVGRLKGFRFSPDASGQGDGIHGKAARNAASHVLAKELAMRVRRVVAAKNDAFKLTRQARVLWRDEEIARLEPGEAPLKPTIQVLCDEHLSGPDKEKVQARLDTWLNEILAERLKPLVEISAAEDIAGLARGIAFRLAENFGILSRESVAEEIRALDQQARAQLRRYGVRFGAFHIYLPILLKPASAELTLALWALKNATAHNLSLDALPEPPRAGLTSVSADRSIPEAFYRAAGFSLCGPRAVRVDMLERLADLIRPLLAWRSNPSNGAQPPKGASGDGGFLVIPEMMSILGCSSEELGEVLKALGFRVERKPAPKVEAAAAPLSTSGATPEPVPQAVAEAEAAESEVASVDAVGESADQPDAVPASESLQAGEAAAQPSDDITAGVIESVAAAASAEAPAATVEVTTAQAEVASTAASEDAEQKFIEIWRPRRRQRGDHKQHHRGDRRPQHQAAGQQARGGGHSPGQGPDARQQERRPRPERGGHHDKRDRRKGNDDRRRNEDRPRPEVRSAGPARKGGGAINPDSPFAALSALRSELEKRAKEQGTT
jgi:ATP-dependent RNA helicase SUPV3L1/SUV3